MQTSSGSLASSLISRERERTFAELYDEIHDVINLRVKISNSIMAVALQEVSASSKNQNVYLSDALSLCTTAINALKNIEESKKEYNIMSKLFKDIFESRKKGECDLDQKKYNTQFRQALNLFKQIEDKEPANKDLLKQTKEFLLGLDKDVEQTYQKEEAMYFGYLRPTAPSR